MYKFNINYDLLFIGKPLKLRYLCRPKVKFF